MAKTESFKVSLTIREIVQLCYGLEKAKERLAEKARQGDIRPSIAAIEMSEMTSLQQKLRRNA